MLKKIALILMTAALLLCGLLTAQAGSLSQADIYAELQAELRRCLDNDENAMPLDNLTKQFESLNGYMKSTQFSYYTAILRDATNKDTSRLALYMRLLWIDKDFCAMLPEEGFPTVPEVEAYALGRQAQEKGDWNAAIGYYEQSFSVLDSMTRIMNLLTAGPTATPTPAPTPLPTATPQPTELIVGDYKITAYHDGTCTITDYTGSAANLAIPYTLGGYRVTSIGQQAFYECTSLTSISIPDSVISIGDLAFYYCTSLTDISLPGSVTSIGEHTFMWCTSLSSISIPDSVTSIGRYAFYNCPLTSISIPNSVTFIADYLFYDCHALASVSIPDSVTSIGDGAFLRCYALTSVNIPDSVVVIGGNPFRSCRKLTDIQISPSHPTLALIDGVLFDTKEDRLVSFPSTSTAKHYDIPYGTKAIGKSAFSEHKTLTSVSVPDSVTSIGDSAFSFCKSLTSISIPDSVTYIGDYAFKNCKSLTSISIPNSVTYIRDYAFQDCDSLTSISIPDSVTYIRDYAFSGCDNLTSISIPASVTSIYGPDVFKDCPNLTLRVPAGSYAQQYAIDNGIPYTTY